jgi:hypothetical protein
MLVVALANSAVAAPASAQHRTTVQRRTTVPAWQRLHHADLDGDGRPDTIWFTVGRDFRTKSNVGIPPQGHWTVHARISSTGQTVSRTFRANGYGQLPKRRWTPWVGATNLDHTAGQDIVLGAEGAADANLYRALVYWSGKLRVLPSPPATNSPDWVIVGAVFHGAGFHCTKRGVAAVDYAAVNNRATRWRLDRTRYVWRSDAWHRVGGKSRLVRTPVRQPPRNVLRFGGFECHGLPTIR